ncbi:MAG: SDR family oxidoreductase [Burkholderiaceae bacterium]
MAKRLEGKRVVMSAAAQGIGKATALALAAEGASVLATDRDGEALKALEGTPGIETAVLDVTDDAAVARVVGGADRIDVLFNCAGYVHQGSIHETTDKDWDFSFRLNVRAMWKMIAAALPKMEKAGAGSIINIASVCSSTKGFPNRFVYGTTKAAVIGMTKSIAADFVGKGIRCNCVCPGTVDTPSLGDRIKQLGDEAEARKMFMARQPTGRLATAEEIAPIVVYLASDESRFATGQAFNVDGGITI